MSNRIIIAGIMGFSILAAVAVTGCSQERVAARGYAEARGGGVLQDGFRIRRDVQRNRIWVLGADSVQVYDGQTRRLAREITLANWSIARFGCDPDMVLDASGSAIVSSNVQPRLWRIDANTFEVTEHPLTLEGRERWDVGIGALAVNADGTLLALTSVSDSLWSIDLGKGSAKAVATTGALLNVCRLATRASRKAGGLDVFTNFVPPAAVARATGGAGTDNIAAANGQAITDGGR
jgi:hypothetical protein